MKKQFTFLFFLVSAYFAVFAENLPEYYFNLGTKRNDVLFDLGNPKIMLPGGHLLYESYSNYSNETITFLFDENEDLAGFTIDIIPDYEHTTIPRQEFVNKVFKAYFDQYKVLYGNPYKETNQGFIWKYDDGFCVFYPSVEHGFVRFHFTLLSRNAAASAGYDGLYN